MDLPVPLDHVCQLFIVHEAGGCAGVWGDPLMIMKVKLLSQSLCSSTPRLALIAILKAESLMKALFLVMELVRDAMGRFVGSRP